MSSADRPIPMGVAGAAGLLFLVMIAAAWWRFSLVRTRSDALPREAWERVKERYPLPMDAAPAEALTPETAASLVEANPFSPQRRNVPPPSDQSSGGNASIAQAPPAPKFAYKGRVHLGARQRAVIEETTGGKTYFLEVGQEVAGFKVLDIDEKRVLLSDPQTHEEVAVSLTSAASPP